MMQWRPFQRAQASLSHYSNALTQRSGGRPSLVGLTRAETSLADAVFKVIGGVGGKAGYGAAFLASFEPKQARLAGLSGLPTLYMGT